MKGIAILTLVLIGLVAGGITPQQNEVLKYKLKYLKSASAPPAPATLVPFRGNIHCFEVTGRTTGKLWGSDMYTDDSDLETAAVHSGFVQPDETTTVTVKVLPGQKSYPSTSRHGITSTSYGSWDGSYSFISATKPPAMEAPLNLVDYRGNNSEIYTFTVIGSQLGNIWGSKIYTDDSHPSKACVHSGYVLPNVTSTITVKILPGQSSYTSTTRNGITSTSYGAWHGSYEIISATVPPAPEAPANLVAFRGKIDDMLIFTVTGSTSGGIWGSDIYTDDSNFAKAAVHSGFVEPNETKIVMVKILPGQSSYASTNENGVTSTSYGAWHGSYSIVGAIKPRAPKAPASLVDLRGNIGEIYTFTVTGTTSGNIWGSQIYTDDSDLHKACVHGGFIKPGVRATVMVKILPGQSSYPSTTENGITSTSYGSWHGSYSIIGAVVG